MTVEYRVRATDGSTVSEWTTVTAQDWPMPNAPTDVAWDGDTATLTWTDTNSGEFNEINHLIQYGEPEGSWVTIDTLDPDTTSWIYSYIAPEVTVPNRLKLSMQRDGDPVDYGPTPEFPAALEETISGSATGWLIGSNSLQAQPSNNGDPAELFWPWFGTDSVRYRTRVRHTNGNCAVRFFLRYVDSNNHIFMYSYQGSSDTLTMGQVVDGVSTDWAAPASNFTTSSAITYEIVDRGDSIEFWADGVLRHTETGVQNLHTSAQKMGIQSQDASSGSRVNIFDLSVDPIYTELPEESVFRADFDQVLNTTEFASYQPHGATANPTFLNSMLVQTDGEHAELGNLSSIEQAFMWDIDGFPENFDVEVRLLSYINTNQGGQGLQIRSSNVNADDALILYMSDNSVFLWGGTTSTLTIPKTFNVGEWHNLKLRVRRHEELDLMADLNEGEGMEYLGSDNDTGTIGNTGIGFRGWYTTGGTVGRDFLDFIDVTEVKLDQTVLEVNCSGWGADPIFDSGPYGVPPEADANNFRVWEEDAPYGWYLPWDSSASFAIIDGPTVMDEQVSWWKQNTTIKLHLYADSWANWSYSAGGDIPKAVTHGVMAHTTRYWGFGPTGNGSLAFYYWNGAQNFVSSTSGAVPTGQWTTVEMQHRNGTIYLLVDGVEVASAAVSGTPQSNPGGNHITFGTNVSPYPVGKWGGCQITHQTDVPSSSLRRVYSTDINYGALSFMTDCQGPLGALTAVRDHSRDSRGHAFSVAGTVTVTKERSWAGDKSWKFTEGASRVYNASDWAFYGSPTLLAKRTYDLVFWIDAYPASNRGLFSYGRVDSNNHRRQLQIKTDGSLDYFASGNSGTTLGTFASAAGAIRLKAWNQVRIVQDMSTVEVFLNQESIGSFATSNTELGNYNFLHIGAARLGNTVNGFGGYIGAFRAYAGLALPGTDVFEPSEFMGGEQPREDKDFDGLRDQVLFHIQGDSSDDRITGTAGTVESGSGAVVDTTVQKFGAPTLRRDGYMSYANTDDQYTIGWDDFTIEYWFRQTADTESYPEVFAFGGWGTGYFGITHGHANVSNRLVVFHYDYSQGAILESVNYWADSLWHKLVMGRSGNFWYLKIDNTLIDSINFNQPINNSGLPIKLAGANSEIWTQDVRFTKAHRSYFLHEPQQANILLPLLRGNEEIGSGPALPPLTDPHYRVAATDKFGRETVSEAVPLTPKIDFLTGLQSWFDFNGNLTDAEGNLTLSQTQGTETYNGDGNAYVADGDRVEGTLSGDLAQASSITCAMTLDWDTLPGVSQVLMRNLQSTTTSTLCWAMTLIDADTVRWAVYNTSGTAYFIDFDITGLDTSTIHQIIGTYDLQTKVAEMFVDGVSVGTVSLVGDLKAGANFGFFNWASGTVDRQLLATVHNAGMWNYPFTVTEANGLWNDGTPMAYSDFAL